MSEHFIKNIEIEKFKCFDNFKAEGFERVNLITGENNVGKTAFMEACFLLSSAFNIFKEHNYNKNTGAKIDRVWFEFELIKLLLEVQQNREKSDFILAWLKEESKINTDNFNIAMNEKFKLVLYDSFIGSEHFGTQAWGNWGHREEVNVVNFRNHKRYGEIYTKNHLPTFKHYIFVSMCNDSQQLNDLIDDLKINSEIKQLNDSLIEMFNIQELDIIKNTIMLKRAGEKFINLSEFGDGIRHFIKIIIVLLSHKDTTIYLDEIENGIHYKNFDKLWGIVLTISKKQNIQVFATTHSKECLESYARVAKKLADEDIALIELGKVDEKIESVVLNYEEIISEIDNGMEVRGWE